MQKMKSTVRSSALGWIVAVNNFDGLFKSARSTTWVQLLQVLNLQSRYTVTIHIQSSCFLLQEETESLNVVKEL